jgi:hypothetical protein
VSKANPYLVEKQHRFWQIQWHGNCLYLLESLKNQDEAERSLNGARPNKATLIGIGAG